jgi:hypothetical protein
VHAAFSGCGASSLIDTSVFSPSCCTATDRYGSAGFRSCAGAQATVATAARTASAAKDWYDELTRMP